jgi:hypothetical protein
MEQSIYQVLLTDISYYFLAVSAMTIFWNRYEARKEAREILQACPA